MLDRPSNPGHFLFAAIFLSALSGLLILITIISVMPTESRFDPFARTSGSKLPSKETFGAVPNESVPTEPFFDYTFVFPEQPPHPAR